MTPEQFKAEILKANPEAQFLESDGLVSCTPTKMMCFDNSENYTVEMSVLAFVPNHTFQIVCRSDRFKGMKVPPQKKKRFLTAAECAGKWVVPKEAQKPHHGVLQMTQQEQIVQLQTEIHRWQIRPSSIDELAELHMRINELRKENQQ